MTATKPQKALIFDAVRSPRGRGKAGGGLATVRPVELGALPLNALLKRQKLSGHEIEDVVFGCVTAVNDQGGNVAKACALEAGLPDSVAGVTVNRFCGSGLEAINQAAARVMSGFESLLIAGGLESMSHVPIGADGGAWSCDPKLAMQTHFVPQGISADLIATLEDFDRQTVDRYAAESQKRAARALAENRFKASIIPMFDEMGQLLLAEDEFVRPDTTVESLGQLKAAFAGIGEEPGFDDIVLQKFPQLERVNHVHHAGNSSGIVDGSAAVLIGNETAMQKYSLRPRGEILSWAVVSTDPTLMLTGPAPAAREALKRAGLKPGDIDLYEVNEAFAAVVLRFMRELEVSHEKVNVNGGAIALGHPLGATGAILLGTLLDELERQNKNLGLVTLCIGGGMGIATIVKRWENA